jgi:hypothetical protein
MSHLYRPTEDLMKIAAAGGGFTIDGGPRSVEDLMRIAAAGSAKRGAYDLHKHECKNHRGAYANRSGRKWLRRIRIKMRPRVSKWRRDARGVIAATARVSVQ